MQQWVAEIAYEGASGAQKVVESFYLPTEEDVRTEVSKKAVTFLRSALIKVPD